MDGSENGKDESPVTFELVVHPGPEELADLKVAGGCEKNEF